MAKRRYAQPITNAFSGEGSRLTGGRWNSRGRIVVYLSEHRSLAALETLVHAPRPELLAEQFVIIEVTIPDELILTLDKAALKPGWSNPSDFTVSQAVGDAWLAERASLALKVPSAIIPEENTLLLAPGHAGWSRLQFGAARPFLFDNRLANV